MPKVNKKWKRQQKRRNKMKKATKLLGPIHPTNLTNAGQECQETQSPVPMEAVKPEIDEWHAYGLNERLLRGVEKMGYVYPTPIQMGCIPHILGGKNVLATSATGSGKTAAFVLPVLHRLDKHADDECGGRGPRALLLSPTRELAMQTMSFVRQLGQHTDLRSVALIGGMSEQKQERLLKRARPDIVVATPGRLWVMVREGLGDEAPLLPLSNVKMLVVDEVDRMVEKGHFEELGKIVNAIYDERFGSQLEGEPETKKSKRPKSAERKKQGSHLQTLVFSATLTLSSKLSTNTSGEEKLRRIVSALRMSNNPRQRVVVDLSGGPEGQSRMLPSSLQEFRMHCANLLKKDTSLYYLLLRYGGRVLVFANSVDCVRRLHSLLGMLKLPSLVLHARMREQKRLKNLERFTASSSAVLLATDVAARGLDIKGVDHVIHYQVPRTTEDYLHRSGRTARVLKEGRTISLIDPLEVQLYERICRSLNKAGHNGNSGGAEMLVCDSRQLYAACEARVGLASECESASHSLKKSLSRRNWFAKASEDAGIALDEEMEMSIDTQKHQGEWQQRHVEKKKRQLEKLLQLTLPSGCSKMSMA